MATDNERSFEFPGFDDLPSINGTPKGCLWGFYDRDGVKDEVGSINLLTPSVVQAAGTSEIRTGRHIQLDWPLHSLSYPGFGRKEFEHKVISLRDGLDTYGFDDELHINTQSGSQWDSLKHHAAQKEAVFYNGLTFDVALETNTNGIHNWCNRGGIVGRGILVDMPRYYEYKTKTSPSGFTRHEINVQDVQDALAYQGTQPRQADILFVRTGFIRDHNAASDEERLKATRKVGEFIGVKACEETVRWLYSHHFAAFVGDTVAFEAWPPVNSSQWILHEWALAWWGTPIGEMWDLEALAVELHGLSFVQVSGVDRQDNKTQNRVVNHVAVAVPSAAEAVEWYSTQLGFELIGNAIQHISRASEPDAGIFRIYPDTLTKVKIAYMATGNGVGFEIFEFPQEQEQREQRADRFQYSRGGFFHICVTDAQPLQLAERVVAAGGQMVGQAVKLGRDASVDCLYVADPWGNVIEILSTSFERLAGGLMEERSEIPAVGLGTWQGQFGSKAADELRASILHALRAGYRLIDTAQYYGVEEIVGAAVRESEVPRNEITVVTKFWGKWHHDPAAALEISLRDLNIEYIDILLMHWPWATSNEGKQLLGPEESPTYVETWKKMEALVGSKCRAIGVSNFTQKTLSVLLRECKIMPAVNQVELHALNPNLKLTPWCEEHGIKVMSWSTMGGGAEYTQTAKEILSHPLFTDIAVAHNIPVGVVSLSWAVQRGIIVIPKSSSTTRIDSNIRLVRLTDTEMETINNAEKIIGRLRLADNIPAMQKDFRGRKTVMGWTAEDYGWEDSEGNWLT